MDPSIWAATEEHLRVALWIANAVVCGYVIRLARRDSGAPRACPICGTHDDPLCVGLRNTLQTLVARRTSESAARVTV